MPLQINDRVYETSSTIGVIPIVLNGAASGYQNVASNISTSNTFPYIIELAGGNEWEIGIGQYISGNNSIIRTEILNSSNNRNIVNFSAGQKNVFISIPAAYTALSVRDLSQFASTTSANLASIISDETGSGKLVFSNNAVFVSPDIGVANGTSLILTGDLSSNIILVGSTTSANTLRFPNAKIIISDTPIGAFRQDEIGNIGIIAEVVGSAATRNAGVYGVGYTSGSYTGQGVVGESHVLSTNDTAPSVGIRGYANDTHIGGLNVGLYGDAANGHANYSLYLNSGDIYTAGTKTWYLNGELTFSGGANTVTIPNLISSNANFTVANGTAPFTVVSNTIVSNLNSDFLDGHHGTYYTGLTGSAWDTANTGVSIGQEAYSTANTKFSSSGGTISGSVTITTDLNVNGNVYLGGNVTTLSSNNLSITDPLIYLAENNPANLQDIGIVGSFTSNKYQHTGIVRDATDGVWKLFSNVSAEPTTTIDFSSDVIYDPLKVGSIITSNAVFSVANGTVPFIVSSNTLIPNLNVDLLDGQHGTYYTGLTGTAFGQANTALTVGQAAFTQANTGVTIGQAAFAAANTALTVGQAAFTQANTGVTIGQAAFAAANTETIGKAAFTQANTKFSSSGGTITGNTTVIGVVTGNTFVSTIATGTAPLTVSSNTVVTNLNADYLDGQHGSYYTTAGNLSGTIPSAVLGNSTLYIGTTAVTLNRASASLALTGISSIDGSSATVASQGAVANNTTGTGLTSGLSHAQVYTNGYPTSYGNVMTMYGSGVSQLLLGWSGTTGADADNYIRSLRDSAVGTAGWSAWRKILTDANIGSYASPLAGSSSITTTGTVTSGTWSGLFGAVSGANLTGLTAGNLSGTIPSAVLGNSTHYIGTTAVTLNRASASLALTGVSIDGNAGTVTTPTFSGDSVVKDDITTRTESGFYETSTGTTAEGWPLNSSAWQHMIACTHSNDTNYYSMQIGGGFFDNVFYGRKVNGTGTTAWVNFLTSENYNTYASPLAGSSSITTIGTVTSGTSAGITGGAANRIVYQTGINTTSFITAPTTTDTFLKWNGSAFAWAAGGTTITNDTTTNASYYLGMSSATSGSLSTAYVSSTGLYFNPSTGTLNSTIYNSLSDESVKTNISIISDSLSIINKINGVEFNWVENDKPSAGVIAQQLETVLPALVDTSESGLKSVNYSGIIGYLIEAIKELNLEINELKKMIK